MTAPDSRTDNTAESGSTIGIQAQQVHNSSVYVAHSDDSPRTKYDAGVRYLDDGVPTRAHELIHDAVVHGHDSCEARFHLLLALLSRRSHRQLDPHDLEQISATQEALDRFPGDQWKRAAQIICDLVSSMNDPTVEPGIVRAELLSLHADLRAKILKHLDQFLTGAIKDEFWGERRDTARNARTSGDRLDRAWAYFCPAPACPRSRIPKPESTTTRDRMLAIAATALFVLAAGYLGWLVLLRAAPVPILGYMLAVAAGYVGTRCGVEWHFRAQRLRETEREMSSTWRVTRAPESGFANRIDNMFVYYFAKFVPDGVDRHRWLAETAGTRNTLRDEVVEIYRESCVHYEAVRWLVRYLVRDVKQR